MADLETQIKISADASGVETGVGKAKRSLSSLGDTAKDAGTKASQSIDRYIKRLEDQNAMLGKTTRQTELYKLALRGATDEQIRAADSVLKLNEAYARGERIGNGIKTGFIAAAALATAATGGLVAMTISAINAADHLNDLSKTTGISVEQLSGLSLAAKQSGGDLQGIANTISKLSQNIGKNGDKFRELGITAKDPLEAFKQLADIFVSIDDPQTRAALGAAALGKQWESAAPLLMEGGRAIGAMVDKGMKLSGVTQQLADDSDKFNDELEVLKVQVVGAANSIAGPLLQSLISIITAFNNARIAGRGFWDSLSIGAVGTKSLETDVKINQDNLAASSKSFGKASAEYARDLKTLESSKKRLADALGPVVAPSIAPVAVDPKKIADFIKPPKKQKAGKDTSGQEAKAQLASDLSDIKSASDAQISIYANAAKIMEAQRAANLIDDKDYYASKLGFLNLNSQAQDDAIQKEIARLKAENLSGKDKIDNDKKIAEAEAKLAKSRQSAVANIEVLSIQEVAANKKVEQSYTDAAMAAQAYLDTINKQNAREIAGIGRGQKFRDEQSGLNTIEDKFTTQSQELSRDKRNGKLTDDEYTRYLSIAQDTYEKEVAAYKDRTDKINKAQGDWSLGASEALQNYADESKNVYQQTADLFTDSLRGMEDALVSFVTTGKLSFKSLADTIVSGITRIIVKQQIASSIGGSGGGGWLTSLIGSGISAFGGTNAIASVASAMPGDALDNFLNLAGARAAGGPVSSNSMYRVNEKGPELLNMAGKQYLMMGNQSGSITPNDQIGGGQQIVVHNNFTIQGAMDRRTQSQIAASAASGAQRAMARNT